MRPKARSTELVVHDMSGETLVYDLKTSKAHCLNETSALVWNSCNGSRSIGDIALLLESKLGPPVDEDIVLLAVKQLGDKDLLASRFEYDLPMPSRRALIRKIGLASAVVIPVVASMVAPLAVMASSCVCVNPGSCLSQTSCPSQVNCNGSHICSP